MRTSRARRVVQVLPIAVVAVLGLAACGDDGGGGSASGADIYSANCARCHGPDGQGGVGPAIGGGAVAERFESIDDQIVLIAEGRGAMPAWEGNLSTEEIRAVAEFTRDDLGN